MFIAIIIVIIMTITTLVMFIVDVFLFSIELSVALTIVFAITLIGWMYISYFLINRKRRELFSKKISHLDRSNEKLENLFVLLDYIEGRETNLAVVKASLNGIYFSPSSMRRHPEKAKKKELYNLLIEYYLTLTRDKYTDSFVWDYNINFFTWRFIGIASCVGLIGIGILMICHSSIPHPNEVLYTSFYIIFGAMLVPLLAKFFGHFI
ncbi:MAG: hypothetical protein NC087_04015 [Anaeroplasma bactoclasticum]|nr:hypothetical protein [Anaeroplasma bactoclasticum]MCM1556679.1 hypothetical protein [Anaeroplasma bactoclasticum]